MYAAVVLYQQSRIQLLKHPEVVKRLGNEDTPLRAEVMNPIAHHMTIAPNLNPTSAEWWKRIIPPDHVYLDVTHIGEWTLPSKRGTGCEWWEREKQGLNFPSVVAVQVKTNVWSQNQTPHITLAINREHKVWPSHSNLITRWTPLDPLTLKGYFDVLD